MFSDIFVFYFDFAIPDSSILVGDLSPYTRYNFEIKAITSAGEGPSATLPVFTEEDGEILIQN